MARFYIRKTEKSWSFNTQHKAVKDKCYMMLLQVMFSVNTPMCS